MECSTSTGRQKERNGKENGVSCSCKSTCMRKRKKKSKRGCPCKTKGLHCGPECRCGLTAKPCKNRVTSSSREVDKHLQGKLPNITPTQPKATTENKDQLDNNINLSSEAKPEEKKQRMEELEEERRLTNDDANSTKFEMQVLKTPFDGQLSSPYCPRSGMGPHDDGQLEKSKRVTSPSCKLEDLQGMYPNITPTQPKATTECKDQLDNNINQSLEAQPEIKKQRMEELEEERRLTEEERRLTEEERRLVEEERRLTNDDANPTKSEMQASKTSFDGPIEKSKRVTSPSCKLENLQGMNPNITPTQPKATTECKDQLDNNINQSLEAQPEVKKQRLEELEEERRSTEEERRLTEEERRLTEEERRLTNDDANPTNSEMQESKTPFDGQLEKSKRVTSPSCKLEDLQGMHPNITPTHPKATAQCKDQLDNNINQSLEAQPEVTSPSCKLEDLQGMHPNITPTQPKATTECKDQLDNNINQSLEAQPEVKKQRMEELEEERRLTEEERKLTNDDANITPTQPKATTETKDQLDNNINQSLEAQSEEKKQRMEEQKEERRLTNDEATPSKTEIQPLKIEFDRQLEESKQVTSPSRELEDLQGKHANITPTQPKASTEYQDQLFALLGDHLDDNTNQFLEAKPEENKQRLEELEEELSLTTDDAKPTIAEAEKHALKTPSDFKPQHSKQDLTTAEQEKVDLETQIAELWVGLEKSRASAAEEMRKQYGYIGEIKRLLEKLRATAEKKPMSSSILKFYEGNNFTGRLQEFGEECNDVTKYLPNGASSILVHKDSETWQVFTEVSFGGVTVNLECGKMYHSPSDMGLLDPVKSFRKAP